MEIIPSLDPAGVARSLSLALLECIRALPRQGVNIALSGGSTPQALFALWAGELRGELPWERINLFWADERCVPPWHPESNYGMAHQALLRQVPIPPHQVHRIRGEDDPHRESRRYSEEVAGALPQADGGPFFDAVLLGIGNDGHAASIFPDQMGLLTSDRPYAVARHPQTGQRRITLTGQPIARSPLVAYMATGESKARVIGELHRNDPVSEGYPAKHLRSAVGRTAFFLDRGAVSLLHGHGG